ncbi:hypothetical protein [Micromonospora sp. I033]
MTTVLSLAATAVGALAVAPPAQAEAVQSGSLVVTGDPDDPITEGRSYSFSTASGHGFDVWGTANHLTVRVYDQATGYWTLDLSAPVGQPLAVGTYTGATANTYESPLPGLALSGNDRSCGGASTGSFTVTDISWGPHDYLERFDATFEQSCAYYPGAARGEVHVANPPAPPVLAVDVAVAASGTVDAGTGEVTVHGTVTCTAPATVYLQGEVTQVQNRLLAKGAFRAEAACTPGTPAAWTASTPSYTSTPFRQGDVEVVGNASAYDTTYDVFVNGDDTAVVRLRKA